MISYVQQAKNLLYDRIGEIRALQDLIPPDGSDVNDEAWCKLEDEYEDIADALKSLGET